MSKADKIYILFSITERGKAKQLISFLDMHNIKLHLQFVGVGTALSDMRDILGLDSIDKDMIVSYGRYSDVASLSVELSDTFSDRGRFGGLMMIVPSNATSKLLSAVISHNNRETVKKESKKMSANSHDFSLILIAVNQGYSDEVMQSAKLSGATGGTVFRARMDGTEILEQAIGADIISEKEIIAILASDNNRNKILEDINNNFGIRSKANGIICALPVEKAFKI